MLVRQGFYKFLISSLVCASFMLCSVPFTAQVACAESPAPSSSPAQPVTEALPVVVPVPVPEGNAPAGAPSQAPEASASPTPEQSPALTTSDSPSPNSTPTAAPEAASTPSSEPTPDVLAPLQGDIVSPKPQNPVLEENTDKRLNLLMSNNPSDFARTEGIWISDSGNGRIIYMKNLDGEDFYTIGIAGYGIGRFLDPEQIWVDIEGKIYVADRGNNRVIRIDDIRGLNWTEMTGYTQPRGVAAHGKRIYVADSGANRILVYDKFGATEPMATLDAPILENPGYLWLDLEGNLYVTCGSYPPGGRVVRIPFNLTTPPSEWVVYEGDGLSGNSFAPTQTLVNKAGIFVIDTASQRLVKIDNMRGRGLWEFGQYGNSAGQFLEPRGLSEDEEGRLYVADTANDRIVRIDTIRGKGWTTYQTFEPTFGLRSPRSIYVWSPRPPKPDPEEENADKAKDKDKDKDKNSDEE